MKKLLLILLLASPVLADVNPAPCVGFDCNVERPEVPTDVAPMPPVINQLTCPDNGWFQLGNTCYPFKFSSHLEAEQHWYHCALGIVIWGDLIKQSIPEFQAVEIRDLIAPVVPFSDCNGFELYPDSNLCSKFQDQREAEANYQACTLTNFQYWDLLTIIRNTPKPTPPSACKRFGRTNIWKARSETRNSSVIVLDSSYCVDDRSFDDMKPIDIWLEDIFGNKIDAGRYRHCNRHNGNRLHYDFTRGSGEAIIQILFEDDTTECFYVPDRSRDQR
jgi:hypothetical protein